MLYDEEKAVEDIKNLPRDVKLHLSHVIRNGLALQVAVCRLFSDGACCEKIKEEMEKLKTSIEEHIMEFERQIKELGL